MLDVLAQAGVHMGPGLLCDGGQRDVTVMSLFVFIKSDPDLTWRR